MDNVVTYRFDDTMLKHSGDIWRTIQVEGKTNSHHYCVLYNIYCFYIPGSWWLNTESCLFLSVIVCDDNTIHSFLRYGNRTRFPSSIWSHLILSTLWSSLTPLGPSWHLLFSASHFVSQLIRHLDSHHMAYFIISIDNLRTLHFSPSDGFLSFSRISPNAILMSINQISPKNLPKSPNIHL